MSALPIKHRKVDMLEKLLTVFTEEQLAQLAEAAVLTKDNAIIRQCTQEFSVEINDTGYVRYFHYRQSVKAIKPAKAE